MFYTGIDQHRRSSVLTTYDAGTLGQLLRTGFIPEAHMISEALRGRRDVPRTRLRLVERSTSCRNSVDRLLETRRPDCAAP